MNKHATLILLSKMVGTHHPKQQFVEFFVEYAHTEFTTKAPCINFLVFFSLVSLLYNHITSHPPLNE